MSGNNKTAFKLDLRTVLIALLVIAVLYLVLSGKLPLGGGTNQGVVSQSTEAQIPLVTGQAQATTASQKESTAPLATTAKASQKATTAAPTAPQAAQESHVARKDYYFRNKSLLNSHYDKHGKEMGFKSAKDYEAAASAVINNPAALYKNEKEDGDHVFYLEATNEFVVLSLDGYIRTYFKPNGGKSYFDRQ